METCYIEFKPTTSDFGDPFSIEQVICYKYVQKFCPSARLKLLKQLPLWDLIEIGRPKLSSLLTSWQSLNEVELFTVI